MTRLWLRPQAPKLGCDALANLIVDMAAAAAQVTHDRQHCRSTESNRRMRMLDATPLIRRDETTITRR
jgi:hypothetical protein